MRQGGMMAAGCLYALNHHVARLADDHENAAFLAAELGSIPGITVEPMDTNIVFFDIADTGLTAAEFNAALLPHGLRFGIHGPARLRGVTHLDLSRDAIVEALGIIREVLKNVRN